MYMWKWVIYVALKAGQISYIESGSYLLHWILGTDNMSWLMGQDWGEEILSYFCFCWFFFGGVNIFWNKDKNIFYLWKLLTLCIGIWVELQQAYWKRTKLTPTNTSFNSLCTTCLLTSFLIGWDHNISTCSANHHETLKMIHLSLSKETIFPSSWLAQYRLRVQW